MSISVKEIAWIAGILEGEACFRFKNTPSIHLRMTDMDIVEKVKLIINPSKPIKIYECIRGGNRKPLYHVSLHGRRAIEWMFTIYSFLGIRRRAKVREIIEVWKTLRQKQRVQVTPQDFNKKLLSQGYNKNHLKFALTLRKAGFTDEQIIEQVKATFSGVH